MEAKDIILASASPRRKELLARVYPTFRVIPSRLRELVPKELGVEIQDWNFAHWDLNRAVARTKHLSVRKINKLHSEALLTLNAI